MKTPVATDMSSFIDRPNDTVTIGKDARRLPERILCKVLIVEASARLDAMVQAEQVFIHGELTGLVRAGVVTVASCGKLVGECHANTFNLAGRFNGLLRARKVVARDGSRLDGEVIADKISRQDRAMLQAHVAAGIGVADREDLLEAAKGRLTASASQSDIRGPDLASRRLAERVEPTKPTIPNFVAASAAERGGRPFLIS